MGKRGRKGKEEQKKRGGKECLTNVGELFCEKNVSRG
jgi:hypothetical protein